MSARVLLVEDDATIAEVVARYLRHEGFSVDCCNDGAVGLQAALDERPDLVLLDIMLPGLDGLEVCRRLRATTSIPVIMLTARGDELDRIAGLDIGADDYVSKPFSPGELVARVRAVLRRAELPVPSAGELVSTGADLRVDVAARTVMLTGEPVALTAREFELLAHLMRNPGRAFRRDELLERVWGYRYGDASTITVHIRRLREKIEADPGAPRFISTVWGVGYRWDG